MKRIICSLAIVIGLGSCINLDEKVYSSMTADKYYENFSDSDIPAALGKLYSDLRLLYAGGSVHTDGCWLYTNEEVGDVWVTPKRGGSWYDAGIYYRLNKHKWLYDDAHIKNNWRRAYTSINTCNRLLYEFTNAGVMTDAMEAEIRTARAFWYFVLCDMYGNVPIQTKYDVPADYAPETSTRQEVFDFILTELEESIPLLSEKEYGRWDRYAATCLLAKMYLNAESWKVEVEDVNAWDKVIEACDFIITSGKYSLAPDYKDSFVTENQNSPEIIMGVVNDEVYDKDEPWRLHLCTMHWKYCYHANTVTQYWGGCCSTPEFAHSYDEDDLRYGKSWFEGQLYDNTGAYTGKTGEPLLCDPWDARDKDKLLIHTKDIPLFEGDEIETTGEAPGVRMLKYEIRVGALNTLSNDFVLFRYADVLFMKAEAIYRKNGKTATQDVADLINAVRERAFTNFTDDKQVKPSELDDERFLQEYAWEFCTEGWRRQQLIRFGAFHTKTWFLHNEPSAEYRLLFPVPKDELLANPKLRQNDGYETIAE